LKKFQKAAAPPDDGSLFEKRKELTKEVESLKRDLTKEVSYFLNKK
jgi:hypothetical protein